MSQLHLGVGEALSYTVVMVLFAPNAALFGVAYLLGPGFAFGVGTTVSPTAVSLGVVPAVPMLAALPADGPTPAWTGALLAVPVLAAGLGAGLAVRRHAPVAHDLAAVRGAAAGVGAGVLVTVLVAVAGGPLGTGRMADVGRPAHRSPGLRLRADGCRWPGRCARRQLAAAPTRCRGATGRTTGSTTTGSTTTGSTTTARSRPSRCFGSLSACPLLPNVLRRDSSCWSPARAPTSRPCSTRARTRRTAPEVVAVGADRDGIEGLARAERAGVADVRAPGRQTSPAASDWDVALTDDRRARSTPTWSCSPGS